jgi:hypothetical protein
MNAMTDKTGSDEMDLEANLESLYGVTLNPEIRDSIQGADTGKAGKLIR